jgi:hypothetical protein
VEVRGPVSLVEPTAGRNPQDLLPGVGHAEVQRYGRWRDGHDHEADLDARSDPEADRSTHTEADPRPDAEADAAADGVPGAVRNGNGDPPRIKRGAFGRAGSDRR